MPDEPDDESDDDGTDYTTMSVKSEHLDMMDDAAESLFNTDRVSRSTVLERLIAEHPDVNVDTLEPINSNVSDSNEDAGGENDDEQDHDTAPQEDDGTAKDDGTESDDDESGIILDGYTDEEN